MEFGWAVVLRVKFIYGLSGYYQKTDFKDSTLGNDAYAPD